MRNVYLATFFLVILTASILGVRGSKFTHPPMDVFPEPFFPGMKEGRKIHPQSSADFFADGRMDRMPPPQVVASSYGPAGQPLRHDDHLYLGKARDGTWARGFPASLKVDMKFLERGRDRFTIYCAPCHGAVGDGNGVTKHYGMGTTATYHDDRLRAMPEGQIYNTISNGLAPALNMPPYADKLAPADRWAVIAYLRALQRAQTGSLADVPDAHKQELGIK